MTDLRVYRGDSKAWTINFKDGDNNPIDITNCHIFFTVKDKNKYVADSNDSDALITKDVSTHVDATTGISQIVISSSDTTSITPRVYVYDMQLKDADNKILTMLFGNFYIDADVTRRTV